MSLDEEDLQDAQNMYDDLSTEEHQFNHYEDESPIFLSQDPGVGQGLSTQAQGLALIDQVLQSQSQSSQPQQFNDFELKEKTAWELHHDTLLTTGCKVIDAFLEGGIQRFGLTEFVGPSGMGKTQLALQLALTVQLPEQCGGLGAGAVYINTDGPFPSQRLAQLCDHFKAKFPTEFTDNPMDNILLENIFDTTETLLQCITQRLPSLLERKKMGLIILDSIAGPFRSNEYDDSYTRMTDLKLVAKTLHNLAYLNNMALVVINQVTGDMSTENTDSYTPALGLAWRNFVTTRIQLSRTDDIRWMDVPFSPYIPVRKIPYEISEQGVFASDEAPHSFNLTPTPEN